MSSRPAGSSCRHSTLAAFFVVGFICVWSGEAALTAINGTLVKVNTDVSLQCLGAAGDSIQWSKSGTALSSASKYTLVSTPDNSTLTIHNTGAGDVGIYTCSYSSGVFAEAHLLSKPVVTKLSSSTSVTDGDTLELKCTGWGWPTPYTLWTREKIFDHIFGESDPGVTMFNVTTDQGLTIPRAGLRIEHMNASDQMTYMCLMVNEVGATNSTTYVRVKDPNAAAWPFIGIVVEIILIIILIIIGEIKRRRSNKIDECKNE